MIMVTGGAGYVGSHTCLELLQAGHRVLVVDNLRNASRASLERVEAICGLAPVFVEADIRDHRLLEEAMRSHGVSAVIHFAGLKAVEESVREPITYYDNNAGGTLQLLKAMQAANVRKLIFSSSATVYGEPRSLPIDEQHPLSPINPYGRSKLMVEDILRDHQAASTDWSIAILRYFNPVGAHESGQIGESPLGIPNNLMAYIAQAAVGRREHLNVWGNDYPTADGTCIRDYIHVVDLAIAHLMVLDTLKETRLLTLNLGTGRGASVLEVVDAFATASGRQIPIVMGPRRAGDVTTCYADPGQANRLLGWSARRSLAEMCADHWRWQRLNPQGY